MSAFRIFSRFADLLDIKVPRSAAAWLRLNPDGTVSERTAAETLADIGVGVTNANVNTAIAANVANTQIALGGGTAGRALFGAADAAAARTTLGIEDFPDLGTAAAADTGDFATAAQGTLAGTALQPSAISLMVESDVTGITGADAITNVISLTQAEYDAIGTPDASTLYIITS